MAAHWLGGLHHRFVSLVPPGVSSVRAGTGILCPMQAPDLNQLSADQLRQLAADLLSRVEHQDRELTYTKTLNQKLTHELALLKRHRFAKRSEQLSALQGELLEELVDADIAAIEAELEQLSPEPIPAKPKQQ